MVIYTVFPLNSALKPRDFEDLWDAIMYQDELTAAGIRSDIEQYAGYGFLDEYIA